MLVVAFDDAEREMLYGLLTGEDHYEVEAAATEAEALNDLLTHPRDGLVVVVSNRDVDHHRCAAFFADVLTHPGWVSLH